MLRPDRGAAEARHVLHGAGGGRHERADAGERRRGGRRAAREPGVPPAEPPSRLSDLRPGWGVPAAGPGARVRSRRQPLPGGEARLQETDPAVASGGPRSGAVCPVRPLHAVLRRDLGRSVPRALREGCRGTGRDRGWRGFPVPVQREHGPDLPRGSADVGSLSLRRPSVRPHVRGLGLPALLCRLQPPGRYPARRGRPAPRSGRVRGERRVALRQGSVRVPVPGLAGAGRDAVDPRPRIGARLFRGGFDLDRRLGRRRAGRDAHRRAPDGRGLLRAVQARAHGLPDERPRSSA